MDNVPEMLSLVLVLKPLQIGSDKIPRKWWGKAAHRLYLSVIDNIDSQLAQLTHYEQGPQPFAVSSLIGYSNRDGIDSSRTYTLRFSALTPDHADCITQAFRKGGPLSIDSLVELDRIQFQIVETHAEAVDHPLAGHNTYQDLAARYLVGEEPSSRYLSMEFSSPTTFHSNGRHIPLPLPEMVFGSLLDRWNAFSTIAFAPEARRYVAECLVVSRFNLRTRGVPVAGGLFSGMLGEVTFTTLNYDRYWMSLLHTLAQFAFYAGVGTKTTMGLGQCRPGDFHLSDSDQ